MIRINLLPQQMSGKAARAATPGGGSVLVAFVLLAAFGITGGVFGFCFYRKVDAENKQKAAIAAYDEAFKKKTDLEKKYMQVRQDLDTLKKQEKILQILDPPEGRLYWAQKLNVLPAFLPEGVFLTRAEVTEDVKEVPTKESRAAYQKWVSAGQVGKAPAQEMTPIIKQRFQIDGVAYVQDGTSDQRLDKIIAFYNNLMDKKVPIPFNNKEVSFMDGITPNIGFDPFEAGEVGGRAVTKFRFWVVTKPLANEAASE